jgi:hypothetical protein
MDVVAILFITTISPCRFLLLLLLLAAFLLINF